MRGVNCSTTWHCLWPLHARQQLTEIMTSRNHPLNPKTPSPLHGACVPATAGKHAELLVYIHVNARHVDKHSTRTPEAVYYDIWFRASDFFFRSEKRMGLLKQSDLAKSDGIKSDLRIRWPKSSEFGPISDSTHRIILSENGIGL